MTDQEPTPGPIVKVARDLSTIMHLAGQLEAQAVARANDRTLPGGDAMVALAPDADLDAWAARIDAAERWHFETCERPSHKDCTVYGAEHVADQDDQDHEDPLATLRWWSDERRERYGYPAERTQTLVTEAAFLRWALDGMWRDEPKWDDFAADVRSTKVRLENLVRSGTRPVARGVPCMYDECKGAQLIRKVVPARGANGEKVWRLTDWHCPRCKRSWAEEDYARNIYAAVERTHWLNLGDEAWCTVDRACRKVGRPGGTVRSWVSRGEVAALCVIGDRPSAPRTFVLLTDVVERDHLARERYAEMVAARQRSRAS